MHVAAAAPFILHPAPTDPSSNNTPKRHTELQREYAFPPTIVMGWTWQEGGLLLHLQAEWRGKRRHARVVVWCVRCPQGTSWKVHRRVAQHSPSRNPTTPQRPPPTGKQASKPNKPHTKTPQHINTPQPPTPMRCTTPERSCPPTPPPRSSCI